MDTKIISKEDETLLMIMETSFEAMMEVLNFTPEQKEQFHILSTQKLKAKYADKNEVMKIFKEMLNVKGITS